jgi:hypothetical protein
VFRVRYGSKYGNKKTTHGGLLYASKKESAYAAELDLRLRAGDIKSWTRQVRMPLDINGYHIANYILDFVVVLADGTTEYVEVKGFETDVWRMKWRLFESLYGGKPGVRLTIVR